MNSEMAFKKLFEDNSYAHSIVIIDLYETAKSISTKSDNLISSVKL